ncbi:N(8)-acetylspermidine oxidase (propane-1,3-diamine-forming) protein [Dioscorea alata]|uniref:N(8)-acetylspermidine oxidase (Propane-1,3-diamine-forming) protein n=1 Tax=Dioscorea alata TaxID=55571 RepID=A0ACB7UX82_DIOAL|nr:N(8)-acetylspermidine oxidase (propane-1,3-diamine-forming) protein [Dioscorea alata]
MGRVVPLLVLSLVLFSLVLLSPITSTATPTHPSVIIVGAGMSGIMAAKTLSDAGITNIQILEATDRIGGRMHKVPFAGINVELGANWVEGVNGNEVNPIWTLANDLNLRNFRSDYTNISANFYKHGGGLYDSSAVEEEIEKTEKVEAAGEEIVPELAENGRDDISILTLQRLLDHVPTDPVGMAVDYYTFDYEFAEPPRVTSMRNTIPLPTFSNFGEDVYFVADQRGYGSIVEHLAGHFLKTDESGNIIDSRISFNKVVREINYTDNGVTVFTEDGETYEADYVMVSVSLGVLQTHLIRFNPVLPNWKILALYQFDMAVYTKIFIKFNETFWPTGNGTEFFLYASERRGYYPIWQQFEKQYPGANVLLVTVSDEESRRIEQQSDEETKAEVMDVLREMFGKDISEATDILVPRWWSDRFFKGTFSNWPIGVSKNEYNEIRKPVGRIHFTGEHTSEHYNGYVHGAYLAARVLFFISFVYTIESDNIVLKEIFRLLCNHTCVCSS